ncbi:MAG: ankyrin repeat domain-containing protein [Spirochaetaceae bacterium]|jgi:hypothetical protein|nr:ankyrin repeat domain-containing protein [Spirochaetaceae bacterium]
MRTMKKMRILIRLAGLASLVFIGCATGNFEKAMQKNDLTAMENVLKEQAGKVNLERCMSSAIRPSYNGVRGFNLNNTIPVLKLLMQYGGNANGYYDGSHLLVAIRENRIEVVKFLLEEKADPNRRDGSGRLPLLTAASRGNFEIVQLLVERGANINSKDNYGTALCYAASNGNFEIVQLLVERGAEVNILTEERETAASLSYKKGNTKIFDYLKAHGARDPAFLSRQTAAPARSPNFEEAVAAAGEVLVGGLPDQGTVAIISVAADSDAEATYVITEIEYRVANSLWGAFKLVDRKSLDAIRTEQKFQFSGEVSDNSAVSIGQMLGATIVITGAINELGSTKTVSFKALDVKTAEILTMVRQQY